MPSARADLPVRLDAVGTRGVPHSRTMTLYSSPPAGTSGSVTFGISRRMRASSSSTSASSARAARSRRRARGRARSARRRSPSPSCGARLPARCALRAALRSSTAWISVRRSRSSASPRSMSGPSASSAPRRRMPSRSTSTCSRSSSQVVHVAVSPSGCRRRSERKPQFGSTRMAREVPCAVAADRRCRRRASRKYDCCEREAARALAGVALRSTSTVPAVDRDESSRSR